MTDCYIKTQIPFSQVSKIWRYLSFKDKNGKEKRFTLAHAGLLAYYSELNECYKSERTIEKELGVTRKTIRNLRKDLSTPTIEMGVPLISVSEFTDTNKEKRIMVEVYPYAKEMGEYYSVIYDKETGDGYRERWINQWEIVKKGGGVKITPRVGYKLPHKENKKNRLIDRGKASKKQAQEREENILPPDKQELLDTLEKNLPETLKQHIPIEIFKELLANHSIDQFKEVLKKFQKDFLIDTRRKKPKIFNYEGILRDKFKKLEN